MEEGRHGPPALCPCVPCSQQALPRRHSCRAGCRQRHGCRRRATPVRRRWSLLLGCGHCSRRSCCQGQAAVHIQDWCGLYHCDPWDKCIGMRCTRSIQTHGGGGRADGACDRHCVSAHCSSSSHAQPRSVCTGGVWQLSVCVCLQTHGSQPQVLAVTMAGLLSCAGGLGVASRRRKKVCRVRGNARAWVAGWLGAERWAQQRHTPGDLRSW